MSGNEESRRHQVSQKYCLVQFSDGLFILETKSVKIASDSFLAVGSTVSCSNFGDGISYDGIIKGLDSSRGNLEELKKQLLKEKDYDRPNPVIPSKKRVDGQASISPKKKRLNGGHTGMKKVQKC